MATLLKFKYPLFVGGKVLQTATDEECAVTKLPDGWYEVAVHGGGSCDVPPSNIVQRAPSVRNAPEPLPSKVAGLEQDAINAGARLGSPKSTESSARLPDRTPGGPGKGRSR